MEIRDPQFDGGRPFDFGKTSADYAKFRDIYPDEFYKKLTGLNLGTENQTVLDLGTGTGVLPRNMYRYGAKWTGADISQNQIEYAKKLSVEKGMDIRYVCSSAEDLDFPPETFDVVTACQCFGYFDKKIVLPKIHELLKTGGHFAVLFMAWLPKEDKIAAKTEELVLKYNPHWTGANMTRYPVNEPDWAKGYFTLSHAEAFDIPVTFTRETWHGRIRSCRGIGASSLTPQEISLWEKEHLEYLKTVPQQFKILHYATILDLKKA